MEIRALTSADASEFHAIRLRALREHPEAFSQSYETQLNTPLEAVTERLRTQSTFGDNFILGCFADGKLIGMVGFARSDGPKEQHKGLIWGMYVASEMQGRGLGKALLSEAIDRARTLDGLEQVVLSVVTSNEQARSLYRSMGFEAYGLQKRVLFVNGEYYDEEHMMLYFGE